MPAPTSLESTGYPLAAMQPGPVISSQSPTPRTPMHTPGRPDSSLVAPTSSTWPTIARSLRNIACYSVLNVLLALIPVAAALNAAKPDESLAIFICSFLAIVPLAALLGYATEELCCHFNETIAGLINATLGNAVELIVAIIALTKCELRLVQSSLLGSMLSNILLVLGMCFCAGGFRYSEQSFNMTAAQTNSSLLMIAVIALLLPAVFYYVLGTRTGPGAVVDAQAGATILKISHGVALLLLLMYLCYCIFQLVTHKDLFADKAAPSVRYGERRTSTATDTLELLPALPRAPTADGAPEEPTLHPAVLGALLLADVVLVWYSSDVLVRSIGGLTARYPALSREFVGLVLLPIVGNAAEHWTAVASASRNRLSLSLSVAIGSSLQIALFVIPFVVTLGWAMGKPLTLFFDAFESAALFLAVLTVNYAIQDGKSNWLEGVILIVLYVIIGTCIFFYSGSEAILSC